MITPHGLSKDWESNGMGSGASGPEHLADCIGWVDDVLTHVVVCVCEDRVKTWSCGNVLCHHPGADIIRRCGALIPVCGDLVDSSVIQGKERLR